MVAEVFNWSIKSRMPTSTIHSIIENLLSKYECNRVLIYTAMADKQILEKVIQAGITIIK